MTNGVTDCAVTPFVFQQLAIAESLELPARREQ